jgi:hypothetical protein
MPLNSSLWIMMTGPLPAADESLEKKHRASPSAGRGVTPVARPVLLRLLAPASKGSGGYPSVHPAGRGYRLSEVAIHGASIYWGDTRLPTDGSAQLHHGLYNMRRLYSRIKPALS